jgi:cysteinyl-tRNA synthetase
MSKSLGNVLLVHELLQLHPPEALRLRLLSGHYRQPLDWSEAAIAQATSTLDGWYRVLRDLAGVDLPAGELPGWDSPWGRGRPGWHIECSAMSAAHLGETIDIHAGGVDLLFPHHENEVAQSTCAHGGKVFARWWMHNGMLTFDGRKMSKSLGNVLLLHELLKLHPAETLRLRLLSGHYRQPLDWSEAAIHQATSTLDGWYRVLRDLTDVALPAGELPVPPRIEAALCDDLNTPQALAELSVLADAARQSGSAEAKAALLGGGQLLGLLQQAPEAWFRRGDEAIDEAHIEDLLEQRRAARASRDFARADAIRDELAALGIAIEDGAQGTRWSIVKA